MKIKAKIAALVLAAATLATALIGCSAYNNPGKYLNIPDFKTLTVTQAEVDEELKTQINEILESLRKAEYEESTDANYEIKLGDQVNIHYTGTPTDASLELVDEVLEGMTNADDEEPLAQPTGAFVLNGAENYKVYPVSEYTAKIGETNYLSLADAITAVKDGETIELLALPTGKSYGHVNIILNANKKLQLWGIL